LRPIRTYPLTTFGILACLFGWMFGIASVFRGNPAPNQFPLGPLIAAAVVSLCLGRAGLTAWWRNLRIVWVAPRWWLLAVLAPTGLIIVAVLANAAMGAPLPTGEQLAGWTNLPGEILGVFLMIGIGEEAGWTAFASPRLLARYRFLIAFAIIATIRVIWHIPLMVNGDLPPLIGIVANAGFQFLVLWAFLRSGGGWLLAAIWHTMQNTVGGLFFFRMVEGADRARLGVFLTVVYWLAVGAVLLIDRKLLRSEPRPEHSSLAH
jgi:membrane protease YdiL (CAAX protease family)